MKTAVVMHESGIWPRHILEEKLAEPKLALLVLDLHLQSHEWVHHRLHQITFQDDTVRHCFTIDLTVPPQAPTLRIFRAQEVRLLPLDLLRKQSFVNFEIYDQAGQRLPCFTRVQLRLLTGVMLTKYAEGLLDAPLPADIATLLHELAARDPVDLQEAQNRWESIAFEDWEAQTVKIAWIAWWNLPPFSNG